VADPGSFAHRGSNGRKSEGLIMPTNTLRLHRVLRAQESLMLLANLVEPEIPD
jgi:hypothetical protein